MDGTLCGRVMFEGREEMTKVNAAFKEMYAVLVFGSSDVFPWLLFRVGLMVKTQERSTRSVFPISWGRFQVCTV